MEKRSHISKMEFITGRLLAEDIIIDSTVIGTEQWLIDRIAAG